MMGYYHDGVGWGGGFVMAVAMVAFWALIVVVLVAIFRGSASSAPPASAPRVEGHGRRALDVLAERYARGEIDTEEFRTRSDVLRDTRPGDE